MREVKVKCGTFTPIARSLAGPTALRAGCTLPGLSGLYFLQVARKGGEDKGALNAQKKSRK